MKWAGGGCHAPGTQRNRSAQTDGSSTPSWCLLGCCPPLTLEAEGAGCSWQLSASLSLPPHVGKIRAGIAGETLNAAAPPPCCVWMAGGVLTHQLGQAGVAAAGPCMGSVLGVSHPIQSLISQRCTCSHCWLRSLVAAQPQSCLHSCPLGSEKPISRGAGEQPGSRRGWESSSAPSEAPAPSPSGGELPAWQRGAARGDGSCIASAADADVTGAGVARRQHPPPRALRSQRRSAPVMSCSSRAAHCRPALPLPCQRWKGECESPYRRSVAFSRAWRARLCKNRLRHRRPKCSRPQAPHLWGPSRTPPLGFSRCAVGGKVCAGLRRLPGYGGIGEADGRARTQRLIA